MAIASDDVKSIGKEEMEEAYNDALLAVYQQIKEGKLDEIRISLNAYVLRVAKNKALDRARSMSRHAKNMQDFIFYESFSRIISNNNEENHQLLVWVGEVVNNLQSPCKELLRFYYYDDLPLKQVAAVMKYKNQDVAKTKKSKCMNIVKAIVKPLKAYENR